MNLRGVVDLLVKEYYQMILIDDDKTPYYNKFDRGIFEAYNIPDDGWSYSIGFKTLVLFNKGWITVHNDGVELNVLGKQRKTFFNCKNQQSLSIFKKELLIILK
jgi:hypothetical protein